MGPEQHQISRNRHLPFPVPLRRTLRKLPVALMENSRRRRRCLRSRPSPSSGGSCEGHLDQPESAALRHLPSDRARPLEPERRVGDVGVC